MDRFINFLAFAKYFRKISRLNLYLPEKQNKNKNIIRKFDTLYNTRSSSHESKEVKPLTKDYPELHPVVRIHFWWL